MRRIIERVVTVVTTTTWKISWEPDTPTQDHPMSTNADDLATSGPLTSTSLGTNHNFSGIEEMKIDQTEGVGIDDPSKNEP